MDYRMPLYIQLQDIIIKKIEEKKYLPGEAIPSERKMAETYGVNRMTVKSAINKLVEQGYLIRKLGAGTYVAQRDYKKIDLSYMDEITGNSGVTAMLTRSGMETSSKVLGFGEVAHSKYLNYKLIGGCVCLCCVSVLFQSYAGNPSRSPVPPLKGVMPHGFRRKRKNSS